ncbi:hypothetical protein EJP82_26805 [Paenibacillus anaericanus]|uniref:Uncharacterized protein n=1 Tax=Paenibacillus anaericanus TaxID=170367 RepID=A0A3S1DGI6_9BACL|nr:hypothetical protein [Paenibacillus anaericanus]RUT38685.1 hypothetical protein EJP82_26805 [Paenibacillus anaericanus]
MLKRFEKMVQKASMKVYQVVSNERGNTNTSTMMWIIGGVVIFVLIIGFVKGWIPELFNTLKEKVQSVW